jgi:hypothetical protein
VETCIEIPIAGWEEIYTFTARTILPQPTAVFVNYYDFALESEDDPLTKAFWEQLCRFNPESCFLDGTISHLVSKRNDVVFRLWDQLKNRDT